ncbi:DnaJ domain-containing protein [Dactylonectria estremocensis]|uniref:DnaJ domain-containing protein n=1 Tax=Dactylonectria estremocensis TaxID=1079267 RepID=A0A9P9J2M5_9HYPO|nr:DnaJ domain-containing protein [Dactylonectria estremocensis]
MAPLSCSIDYYAVLGVPYTADEATIKAAYRRLAHLKHPDKNGDSPESTEEFQLLQSAYATLADRKQRRRFDRQYLPPQPRNPYNYQWHFTFSHQIFTVTGPSQTISPQPYRWGSAYSRRETRQTNDHNGMRQGDSSQDKKFTDMEEVRCRAHEIKRVAKDRVRAERDRKDMLQADLEERRERVEEMRRARQEMDDRRRELEQRLAARK